MPDMEKGVFVLYYYKDVHQYLESFEAFSFMIHINGAYIIAYTRIEFCDNIKKSKK